MRKAMPVLGVRCQIDLTHSARALGRFASGLFDRQAESMCALAGFLKVLAACLERNPFRGSTQMERQL